MKKIKIVLVSFIASFYLISATAKAQEVNFAIFQQELSPYGQWVMHPHFGEVWIYNEPNFRPYYTNGHWEYTDYGWSWASDYEWGNIPFHYGRWENDSYYGWMWIPGYEWAPAWVSWSEYDNYYGWAPLGYGTSINVGFNDIAYNNWTFIPKNNIYDHDLYRYYISPNRNYGFRNAMLINNYYKNNSREGFMRGPDRFEAQRFINNNITSRKSDDRDRQYRAFNNENRFNNTAVNNNIQPRNDNRKSTDIAYNNPQLQRSPVTYQNRNYNNVVPQQQRVEQPVRQNNYVPQQQRFEQSVIQQQAQVTRQAEYRNGNNTNQQKSSNTNDYQQRRRN